MKVIGSLFPLSALCVLAAPAMAGVSFSTNQVDVSIAPSCNHVPVSLPYQTSGPGYDESQIQVSSDAAWATPSVNSTDDVIEISFSTDQLIASYTATISVNDGEQVTELFINANVSPLDVYRLLDDPLRSRTYGIHRDGTDAGAVIAFDPVQETTLSCVTVGQGPTDFAITDDSSELLVVNSVSRTIDVIDLASLTVQETISLPTYTAWGDPEDTTANIDLGPNGVVYYSDGAWAPVLHVLDRASGDVVQSTTFFDIFGFMDFAVTSDYAHMVAMPQYGWSAGAHTSKIGHLAIEPDGTVSFQKTTTLGVFERAPFEAPVLLRDDDEVAVLKTVAVDPADTDVIDRSFPSAIWSMNPNGSVVATADALYDYETGVELYKIPGATISGSSDIYRKAQAFTSDFSRFVYFDSGDRSLNVVNLVEEIGLEQMGRSMTPANGSVVNSPDSLTWSPLTGIDQYDVYLGTDYSSVAVAGDSSPAYLGRVTGSSLALPEQLSNGTEYFWRVDPVTPVGSETGGVFSFRVSDVSVSPAQIDALTVSGHPDYLVEVSLESVDPGVAWSASAADPWISFSESAGSTPATLSVHLDASLLPDGFHSSEIVLASEVGELAIPVDLSIEPLSLTHIRSDRESATVYAISEDLDSVPSSAYLLEMDADSEQILRVVPVGSSVTDVAIHYPDDLIYVTNWKAGNLLVIDRDSLSKIKSIAFQPAGPTGSSSGDVYGVAAGVSQRLVIDEEDQWISVDLFNTNTEETLDSISLREGGGQFDPTGRYYYFGENNISNAEIMKYDTSGDVFTQLAGVRPSGMASYYGSRNVVVSDDGSRIFWSGVAFDADLGVEWAIGELVYASSSDGRYAFAEDVIYDVDAQSRVLGMPVSTVVSGYNANAGKLVVQQDGEVRFYPLGSSIAIPAPVLNVDDMSFNAIDLGWTDNSLELEFVVQMRPQGSDVWLEGATTAANVTTWTAAGLEEGASYEFRVRASAEGVSSSWSNVVSATALERPNIPPVAVDDTVYLADPESVRFDLVGNDRDSDGYIDPDSVEIVSQPQFGEVMVHAGGEVSYIPGEGFVQTDSFSYTVRDNDGGVSNSAVVTVDVNKPPELSVDRVNYDSVELKWFDDPVEDNYVLQIREAGPRSWFEVPEQSGRTSSWLITGLSPGKTYEFRIRDSSSGLWSNVVEASIKSTTRSGKKKVILIEEDPADDAGAGCALLSLLLVPLFLRRRVRFPG
ncbi:MAG: fibronectin type III domain-containing protein [Alcanivoracaceae bacterium]|nr:fibronectin type III domain-containing protein [Alcanivoracaceae bacterium]